MNTKKLLKWEIIGGIFLILAGSFMHFVYSDIWKSIFTALIAPINESVWEHMKLAYIPLFLFSWFEYKIINYKNLPNFLFTKVLEMYIIMLTIIISFYGYTWILGRNILILDILTYVFGVIIGQIFSYKMLKNNWANKNYWWIGVALITVLVFSFSFFTFWPPNISMFIAK